MAPPLLQLPLNFNIYLNSSPTDAKTRMFTHPCNQLKKKRNENRVKTRQVPLVPHVLKVCVLSAEERTAFLPARPVGDFSDSPTPPQPGGMSRAETLGLP